LIRCCLAATSKAPAPYETYNAFFTLKGEYKVTEQNLGKDKIERAAEGLQ